MKQKNYRNNSNIEYTKSGCKLNGNIDLSVFEESRIQDFLDNNNITTIGKWAFKGVVADKLIIPESVKEIDGYSFIGCKINKIVLTSDDVFVDRNAFKDSIIQELVLSRKRINTIDSFISIEDYPKYLGISNHSTKISVLSASKENPEMTE